MPNAASTKTDEAINPGKLRSSKVAKPSQQRRIALLIDTATTWGAGLIEGVATYAKSGEKPWVFSFEPRGKYDKMLLSDRWRGDGVVARVTHPGLAEQLIGAKIPAVDVSWFRHGGDVIPRCSCDEAAAGELAATYFLENGFRQFAYCPSNLRPNYYDRLGDAFIKSLGKRGYRCEEFTRDDESFGQLDYDEQLRVLADWLKSLPRPVALLTFDDLQGRQITEACGQAGISVPDDVAVLGGDHDHLCARISSPPLSGIDLAPTEVGYRAAEMLDRLMNGEELESLNVIIPPSRIITQQSTDKVAVDDELLAEAIRYIRKHYADELRIRHILHAIPLSRRSLEIGFREHLGRTPREEIRRIRVQKALELLCDTDWPITKIATACGFDRPELLTRAFRRELKSTPSEFRKRLTQRQ